MCGPRLETQGLHYQDNLVQDFAESRISSYTAEAHSDISRGEQAGRIPQEKLVKQLGAPTVRFCATNERVGQKRPRKGWAFSEKLCESNVQCTGDSLRHSGLKEDSGTPSGSQPTEGQTRAKRLSEEPSRQTRESGWKDSLVLWIGLLADTE